MMTLEDIQKRFEEATEKEHWEKLRTLLFSEDKENVVMGFHQVARMMFRRTRAERIAINDQLNVGFSQMSLFKLPDHLKVS